LASFSSTSTVVADDPSLAELLLVVLRPRLRVRIGGVLGGDALLLRLLWLLPFLLLLLRKP
jgi:hypothetical protein